MNSFNTPSNIMLILGQRMDAILSINPKVDGAPEVEGNCQWATIEAAKVLLNNEYKPCPLKDFPADIDEADPIEKYLDDPSLDVRHCHNFSELNDAMKTLKDGELLIVNGDAEISHAYLILNKNKNYWLMDADRGIYKKISSEEDLIEKNIPGWVKDNPDGDSLDYLNMRFADSPETDEYSEFETYKLSAKDFNLLPNPHPQKKHKQDSSLDKNKP